MKGQKNNTQATGTSNLQVMKASDSTSVPTLLETLKAELKGLNQITETNYLTDGKVQGFTVSIQEETKMEDLVKRVSSLLGRKRGYDEAQALLAQEVGGEFAVQPFKEYGQSVESLLKDIVLRIKVVSVSERKKELEGLLKEAEQFVTKEHLFEMFQQKVAKATGGKGLQELTNG